MSASDVIYPPPDIKSVIDKTAEFVAKVGEDFEKKVVVQQAGQAKFAFLQLGNPYRKYYELRVRELKEGREASKPAVPQALLDFKQQEEEKRKRREERKMLGDGLVREYPPPPPLLYQIDRPYITPLDDDIIKITAQFVALHGSKFLQGLIQREGKNPQFDFLKSEHDLYPYFESLVVSYQRVLVVPPEEEEKLKAFSVSKEAIIERITNRYMYMAQEARKLADKAKVEEQLQSAMNRIDWANFIIVDTLEFPADESIPLALPLDPKTLKPMITTDAPVPLAGNADDLSDSSGVVFSYEPVLAGDVAQPLQEEPEILMDDHKEEKLIDDQFGQNATPLVTIRTDYVRHPKKSATFEDPLIKSPITGELIPESQFGEHMRVTLIDPKWKEQSEKVLKRAKESGSALALDITENLVNLVKSRADLFEQAPMEQPDPKRLKK